MQTYDAILLLGLKLHPDGSPTHELELRIEKAAQCYHKGLSELIIPCGGQTPGTPVTEAEVMQQSLLALGVPSSAICKEDASQYTVENIRNARKLLPQKKPRVLVVTSDYHTLRACMICRGTAGMRAKGCKARIPWHEKRVAAILEPLHTIDYMLGYQCTGKKRPKFYLKVMYFLMDTVKNKYTSV